MTSSRSSHAAHSRKIRDTPGLLGSLEVVHMLALVVMEGATLLLCAAALGKTTLALISRATEPDGRAVPEAHSMVLEVG